jgi:hypothetical protein
MCTVVILRRPGDAWPLLLAANRDEIEDRPWAPPERHWPDRPQVVAGLDRLAGGSWLGLNDDGVVAAVMNRTNSLGPQAGKRSRGELVLEALDHADATAAARALADIDTSAYRSFNLVIADSRDAFWLRAQGENGSGGVEVLNIPPGLSMITAHDRNDRRSPRIRAYLPRFRAAPVPAPESGDWKAWENLLGCRLHSADTGPGGAMNVAIAPADPESGAAPGRPPGGAGFGTVSSSLIALPAAASAPVRPIWRFAAGKPDEVPYADIAWIRAGRRQFHKSRQ